MNTKRLYFLFIFLVLIGIHSGYIYGEEVVNMQQVGHHDPQNIIPIPADMPDVYYNNVSQTIIIDGTGEVNYYDVEILSLTSFDVVIYTQVNGYYDTIDISSLPVGEYAITIDSPTGNSFEGFFETY